MNNESETVTKTANCKIEPIDAILPFSDIPNIANVLSGMSEKERTVAIALAGKEPRTSWDLVAKNLGMSTRQLFNYRTKESVLNATSLLVREMVKRDVPEVLKRLAKEAKNGKPWAIRIFLEWAKEINTHESQNDQYTNINLFSAVRSPTAEQTLARATELLSTEELREQLVERMKLSARGVKTSLPP